MNEVQKARIELGTSPVEIAAEYLEDSRPELREALKMLDCTEHRDLYERVQGLVLEIDDLRAILAERHAS